MSNSIACQTDFNDCENEFLKLANDFRDVYVKKQRKEDNLKSEMDRLMSFIEHQDHDMLILLERNTLLKASNIVLQASNSFLSDVNQQKTLESLRENPVSLRTRSCKRVRG